MFETTTQNSQYQSHSLRPKTKSLGLKNETCKSLRNVLTKNVDSSILIIVQGKCLTLFLEQTIVLKVGSWDSVSNYETNQQNYQYQSQC